LVKILATPAALSFDYRFFVIVACNNAFAVPGGSIYMFTGMIGGPRAPMSRRCNGP
jgi:predicted Zn-dependent protease